MTAHQSSTGGRARAALGTRNMPRIFSANLSVGSIMTNPLYSVLMQSAIAHTRLIVGLEIHVELCTRSKMFTRAPNPAHVDFDGSDPNSLVDPLVAALPGTLPVMNRAAVEMSARVGMALGCEIAKQCRWDRKNYFYPDLPKGYQISQYDQPLCGEGKFELPLDDGSTKTIGIIRAHLERTPANLAMNFLAVAITTEVWWT